MNLIHWCRTLTSSFRVVVICENWKSKLRRRYCLPIARLNSLQIGSAMKPVQNDENTPAVAAQTMSKNAQKRLLKQQRFEEKKAEKKAQMKEHKKKEAERKRKEWEEKLASVGEEEREKIIEERRGLRKERMEKRSVERGNKIERLQEARIKGQNVVIDLEFAHLMSSTELHSLVQQITYCYVINGRSALPAHIWLTGCQGEMQNQLLRIPGYDNWLIEKEDRSYVEAFKDQKVNLVYLTADSENVLDELDPKAIYIIGGLVDRNRWKGITMKKAEEQGIKTAKLPIGTYMKMSSSQITYCYAINGRSALPAHIWLTGCQGEMQNQLLRIPGYDNWLIEKEDRSYVEAFKDQKVNLVYLTADSENVLDELDPKAIYIIGGLVDRNRWKGITMKKAEEQGIKTAKLPIGTYMKMSSSQITYCYAINGRSALPAHIWLTGCQGEMQNQLLRIPGYDNWLIEKEDRSYVEAFKDQKVNLVYLTADSENVLDELDPKAIYIIGGLVDRNRWKGITMKKAEEQGIKTAKLPIGTYMKMSSSQVLTVNQVVEILLKFLGTKDWRDSFFQVIPLRKRCLSGSECSAEELEKEGTYEEDEKMPEIQEEAGTDMENGVDCQKIERLERENSVEIDDQKPKRLCTET